VLILVLVALAPAHAMPPWLRSGAEGNGGLSSRSG
jgi:hypothetical protein